MKKIAVFVHSLTVEYSLNVLNGISEYFKDKPVQLIICPVQTPHSTQGIYEYQCWAGANYLFSNEIDAAIIVSGSFSSSIDTKSLEQALKPLKNKPVVSVGLPLNLQNCCSTQIECKSTYNHIIKHLKKQHGCKKIGFFSANQTGSTEALERFEAYKEALKENKLKYDEKLILHGSFTSSSAIRAIEYAYKSKKEIPFDAIVCANDLMAVGCQKALLKLGVKIPEEVKIVGFDDATHASFAKPKLSTVNQNVFEQGYLAAEVMDRKLNGEEIPEVSILTAEPLYRQSCGCIPLKNCEDVYRNKKLKMCHKAEEQSLRLKQDDNYFNYLSQINNINLIFDMVTSAQTLRRFSYTLKFLMDTAKMSGIGVCLLDEPVQLEREDDFELPEKLSVSILIDKNKNILEYEPGIILDPRKNILPGNTFKDEAGNYILYPIFSGTTNYGYIICQLTNYEFSVYGVILKILINAICQSYEYTKTIKANEQLTEQNQVLQQNNTNLSMQSKTDELTKILNRRGFNELGQRTIDIAVEMDSSGMLFFMDMDGLKKINDTYGHKTGDTAIKAMAQVLTLALRANDIVARLSGDEFAAVAVGMNHEQVEKVRTKIDRLCTELEKENNFQFKLSCSVGSVEFNKEHYNLKELLQVADERLYSEKRQKHSRP